MSIPIPFVAERFKYAAEHYLAGRPAYAPALIRRVAEACGLGLRHRVLDLGCGPGQLATAFATWAGHVLAVDPEAEMLRLAAALAAGLAPNITCRQGSSLDLGPEWGRFHLAVMGRSFHWMDRQETLSRLDGMIDQDGAVVLFNTTTAEDGPAWLEDYRAVIERYSADDPARRQRRSPDWQPHEAVLLRSPFYALERMTVIERRLTPVSHLKARALSMSSLSPARLGAQVESLLQEITLLASDHAPSGWFEETVESTAIIARRPV